MKFALTMIIAALALAQEPPKKVEFEVASIRPVKDDNDHDSDTHNLTLKRLIAIAYEIDARQIVGGPAWVDVDSYDINAKIPPELRRVHAKMYRR